MSKVVAFPLRRITTASFVDSVLRRARQLRDDRLAREQAMPGPSGSVAPFPGAICADQPGAATALETHAHPDRARGGRRTNSEGGQS